MLSHKGFVAYLSDGRTIFEVNNRVDPDLGVHKATNWHRVDKALLKSLELQYKGVTVASLHSYDGMQPEDWFFCHSAVQDLASSSPKVLSRSIGIRKRGLLHIFRVDEATGAVTAEVRPA